MKEGMSCIDCELWIDLNNNEKGPKMCGVIQTMKWTELSLVSQTEYIFYRG